MFGPIGTTLTRFFFAKRTQFYQEPARQACSLTDAQSKIARLYGFGSGPKLRAHIETLEEFGTLKQAIDTNDFERVKFLMTKNPPPRAARLKQEWPAHVGSRVRLRAGTEHEHCGARFEHGLTALGRK